MSILSRYFALFFFAIRVRWPPWPRVHFEPKTKRRVGIFSPGGEGESPYLWIGEEVMDPITVYLTVD